MHLKIDGTVATLTLDRPPVNAMNRAWLAAFNTALDEIEKSGKVNVIHIRSALRTFCAGADLDLMRSLLDTSEGCDTMVEFVRQIQTALFRLENSSATSVAELGGAALGGGLELALACDLRVAGDTSRIGLPEAGLGLIPGAGGTQRVTRICGEAIARRLILGAEVIDGREALRLGLVQWSLPADELDNFTLALVDRLSTLPGGAVAAAKTCIAAAIEPAANGYELELSGTRRLHDSAETRKRVQDFLERSA